MDINQQNGQQQFFQHYGIGIEQQPQHTEHFEASIELVSVNAHGQAMGAENSKFVLFVNTPGFLILAVKQYFAQIMPQNWPVNLITFGTYVVQNYQNRQIYTPVDQYEPILDGKKYLIKMHVSGEERGEGQQQEMEIGQWNVTHHQGIVIEGIMPHLNVHEPTLVPFTNAWITKTTFSSKHFLHTTEGICYDHILKFEIEDIAKFVVLGSDDIRHRTIGLNSDLPDFGPFGQFQVKVIIKNTKVSASEGGGRRLKMWSFLGWLPPTQGKKEITMNVAMNYLNSNNCLELQNTVSEIFNYDLDRKFCAAPQKFLGQLLASPANNIVRNGKLSIIFGFNFVE